MEKVNLISFADQLVSHRIIKDQFLKQIDQLLSWNKIEKVIKRHYSKGESASGRPSYAGIILFKMTLLQTWYGLSDYELEDQVKDRISFSRFVGIPMEGDVPDHSVISRFRTTLTTKGAYEELLTEINQQLTNHGILVRTGVIVDASITDTLRKPRGKKQLEVVEDRNEPDQKESTVVVEVVPSHVDGDAKWTKKNNIFRFGYKQHTGVNEEGLVVSVVTTAANESDTKHLEAVLDKAGLGEGDVVMADKGYCSQSNDELLAGRKLKNEIMRKAVKGKPLTQDEQEKNRIISKTRYKVERTFGSMRCWFKGGVARYIGIAKMHTQHLMEAIGYNLYRSPRIIVPNC